MNRLLICGFLCLLMVFSSMVSVAQNRIVLNKWSLMVGGKSDKALFMSVPGSAKDALIQAKRLPDYFSPSYDRELRKLEDSSFSFQTTVQIQDFKKTVEDYFLDFHTPNMRWKLKVNGSLVDSGFGGCSHSFSVGKYLKVGANNIMIDLSQYYYYGFTNLDLGFSAPIVLRKESVCALLEVSPRKDISGLGMEILRVGLKIRPFVMGNYEVRLVSNNNEFPTYNAYGEQLVRDSIFSLPIVPKVYPIRRWNPLEPASLKPYEATVEVKINGSITKSFPVKIYYKDEDTSSYKGVLQIGDKKMALHGLDHDVASVVSQNWTKRDILNMLVELKEQNVNYLEILKGYEQEYFYDACDSLGIVVCQEVYNCDELAKSKIGLLAKRHPAICFYYYNMTEKYYCHNDFNKLEFSKIRLRSIRRSSDYGEYDQYPFFTLINDDKSQSYVENVKKINDYVNNTIGRNRYIISKYFEWPKDIEDQKVVTHIVSSRELIKASNYDFGQNKQKRIILGKTIEGNGKLMSQAFYDLKGRKQVRINALKEALSPVSIRLEKLDNAILFYVDNSSSKLFRGALQYEVYDLEGRVLSNSSVDVTVDNNTNQAVSTRFISGLIGKNNPKKIYLKAALISDNQEVFSLVHYFVPIGKVEFSGTKPDISIKKDVTGVYVTLTAKEITEGVAVSSRFDSVSKSPRMLQLLPGIKETFRFNASKMTDAEWLKGLKIDNLKPYLPDTADWKLLKVISIDTKVEEYNLKLPLNGFKKVRIVLVQEENDFIKSKWSDFKVVGKNNSFSNIDIKGNVNSWAFYGWTFFGENKSNEGYYMYGMGQKEYDIPKDSNLLIGKINWVYPDHVENPRTIHVKMKVFVQ